MTSHYSIAALVDIDEDKLLTVPGISILLSLSNGNIYYRVCQLGAASHAAKFEL